MQNIIPSTSKALKFITIGLIALIIITVCVIVYRMFFQFSAKDIKAYANDAASRYKNKEAAFAVIMDGVEHILSSHNLTQQVLKKASITGIDKEQELVAAAVQQCKAYSYLS
jgi:hypothetical protein